MSLYSTASELTASRYIDQEALRKKYGDEGIFLMVFDDVITGKMYRSPLRVDKNPKCYFEHDGKKLKFFDYAMSYKPFDCFDIVQKYFGIKNYRDVLLFIDQYIDEYIESKSDRIQVQVTKRVEKLGVRTRDFDFRDANFWSKYRISSFQLETDGVYAVGALKVNNNPKRIIQGIVYVYTDFPDNKIKVYLPYNKNRFLTNCKADDLGGINFLSGKESLFITKSYKDYRVLKNHGLDVIWFQSENQFPNGQLLYDVLVRYKSVTILFDNDNAGLSNAIKLKGYLSQLHNNVQYVHINQNLLEQYGIKDYADLEERVYLREFLYKKQLII